jgi:hypothetical protein
MFSRLTLESLPFIQLSPPLTIPSGIILLAIVVAAAFYLPLFYQKRAIPFYVAGDPQKRWMFDSLNLLQEGYNKVSNMPRVLVCEQKCVSNWPTDSSLTNHFRSGPPRGIKSLLLRNMLMN